MPSAGETNNNTINDVGIISMHDFLDFLKISCHVNEVIENKSSSGCLDYKNLAKNELVNNLLSKTNNPTIKSGDSSDKEKESGCRKSPLKEKKEKSSSGRRRFSLTKTNQKIKQENDYNGHLDPFLKDKLNEVINEGILDSVLPFVCPAQNLTIQNTTKNIKPQNPNQLVSKSQILEFKTEQTENEQKKSPIPTENSLVPPPRERSSRRRSINNSPAQSDGKSESDVVIHVCDEVKGVSKDFMCPQKLLVSKMGYFADVTSGQRLEDMDISVHCDLQIFEWLMRWVKKETLASEEPPSLDPSNVVPILVSASFLQMEPLLLDCLSFCHSRLNEVVKASANLSCLNDGIITRLAAMFTNLELEMVKDKKDRVAPRLWTKLIQSLCEPESQSLRGHYASIAGLFRCIRCGKYMTQAVSSYIYCIPQNMRLNRWGQLVSQHARDTNWNITNYVATLYKEMRSWRKVYWRLWGHCHFLYCSVCEMHFPTYQMMWCCQYHPDQPQFLGPITEGKIAGPSGRYPCCGKVSYRFETLVGPCGCQFREHTVHLDNDKDRAIFQLSQIASEGGCSLSEPVQNKIVPGSADPWWNGLALLPHRSRQGLLPSLHVDDPNLKGLKKQIGLNRQTSIIESTSETESSDNSRPIVLQRRYSSSSDGGEESDHQNSPKRYRTRRLKRRIRMSCGRYWSGEMSARSNQDNQREFEEKAMKQVITMVSKRTRCDVNVHYQNFQNGGTYTKLESEWRESLKQRSTKIKPNTK